jgi:CubicO group peptidase (beta-lactamase class C family)
MRTLFIAVFLSTTLVVMGQESTKNYDEAFKLVEVWLDAQKDYEKLPGISSIVVEDQKVLWKGAFGMANPDENLNTTTNTLCSICSISKLFTSVAIMKLYDEGKLRLDDRVSDLLPHYNLEQQYPESGPITVRSLMTHSSGLPRESAHPYWTGPDFPFPTLEEIDSKLGSQKTLYPASTYFQYSNLGLTLLGEIVAEVSGLPYETYVKQEILQPLGIVDTRPEMPEDLYGKQLAIGYTALNREGKRERVNFFQARGITAAAGFTSNVEDLGRFASWQFRLRDTTAAEILKPSTLKYMQSVHWTDPDWKLTWGLGFVVRKGPDGNTWVGHGGSCPGYRSSLQLDLKKKRGYAVMINSSGTNPGKYISGIHGILGKVKNTKEEDEGPESADLVQYTGYYDSMPWSSEVYIGTWYGKLVVLDLPTENPANAMTLFKHVEGDTFRRVRDDGELGEALVFERDVNGSITRYQRHGNYSNKKTP